MLAGDAPGNRHGYHGDGDKLKQKSFNDLS